MTPKISDFLAREKPATPCLVLDLDVVAQNYCTLKTAFPDTGLFYAVKANPAPQILQRLAGLGCAFDAASHAEVEMVLAAGACADRISYGNLIKKETDIAKAFALGVGLFAFDSTDELLKIARAAPGTKVFCRVRTGGAGADWPLSHKFGCAPAMAKNLLLAAADMNVEPYGVSFHVGSQQRDPAQWESAIGICAHLFDALHEHGVTLKMINLGGGIPTRYRTDVPSAKEVADVIHRALSNQFGNRVPATMLEPGRVLVADAGVIETEVVLVSQKSAHDKKRWIYLDVGKFGGLAETMDEAIQYPMTSTRPGTPVPVILAGPTCDGADVLYQHADYQLPADLAAGDRVRIHVTGAYTTTYASVGFNGFDPLFAHYI